MQDVEMERWEQRVAEVWAGTGHHSPAEVVRSITVLAGERPTDDAAGVYELASVYDFADREAEAEPLYRRALGLGLDDGRRPQAVIQLASTLRNLGRPGESIELLRAEQAGDPADDLGDVRAAFLALALADAGRPQEGLVLALSALATHLPGYARAVTTYAARL